MFTWGAFKNMDVQTSPRPIKLDISEGETQDQKVPLSGLDSDLRNEGEWKM